MHKLTPSSAICALVAALWLVVMAMGGYLHDRVADTFVKGCDCFGYLRMAGAIRDARASGHAVDFSIHDAQTRWLIGKFKESKLPVSSWDEVVTAHAHHYFPASDQVGPQYPARHRLDALFFKSDPVKKMDRWTITILTCISIAIILWCAVNGLALSGFMVAGATGLFLSPYDWIGITSYSINASVLPLFEGTLLAWLAAVCLSRRISMITGLCSGLLLGLAIQVRLPSILFLPAVVLIFFPRKLRSLPWLLAGVVLNGIIPLLLHDKAVTGNYFGATYNGDDRRQTLGVIYKNTLFYLQHARDSGCYYVLGLFLGMLLLVALIAFTTSGVAPGWKAWLAAHCGMVAAPVCAFALPVAYFLTHAVAIEYYLVNGMLLTGLLIALLFVVTEIQWQKGGAPRAQDGMLYNVIATMTALAAISVLSLNHAKLRKMYRQAMQPVYVPEPRLDVPAALLDGSAWIWADMYSSSIVYYTGHPAFKLPFSSPEIRKLMYDWIKTKGDTQYMVADSGTMKQLVAEAQSSGWQLTPTGYVHGAPCYKMEWP